jgi:hypothetical protein
MARIILGIATSHSPLLVLGGGQWEVRSRDDQRSKTLNMPSAKKHWTVASSPHCGQATRKH